MSEESLKRVAAEIINLYFVFTKIIDSLGDVDECDSLWDKTYEGGREISGVILYAAARLRDDFMNDVKLNSIEIYKELFFKINHSPDLALQLCKRAIQDTIANQFTQNSESKQSPTLKSVVKACSLLMRFDTERSMTNLKRTIRIQLVHYLLRVERIILLLPILEERIVLLQEFSKFLTLLEDPVPRNLYHGLFTSRPGSSLALNVALDLILPAALIGIVHDYSCTLDLCDDNDAKEIFTRLLDLPNPTETAASNKFTTLYLQKKNLMWTQHVGGTGSFSSVNFEITGSSITDHSGSWMDIN